MKIVGMLEFAVFFVMLTGLLFFHRRKLRVAAAGFTFMSVLYIVELGLGHYAGHLSEQHRWHLLANLALLIPGFTVVSYYFEHSGASDRLALSWLVRTDTRLLWTVFMLSVGVDNIAACMIGGQLLLSRYGGGNVPFRMLIGVIGAANLGGAGSFVGDTTTVMLFAAGKLPAELAKAFVPSVVSQVLLAFWASRHMHAPRPSGVIRQEEQRYVEEAEQQTAGDTGERTHEVSWSMLLPVILGVVGLILGHFVAEWPGPGLWVGALAGCVLGKIPLRVDVLWYIGGHEPKKDTEPAKEDHGGSNAIQNTWFLLLLVGSAELLPLEMLNGILQMFTSDQVAFALGLMSPWFDNIPLTAVALKLGGFDWGLLAFAVGFGGSSMWFGSTAGVSLGTTYPEIYETKRWLGWRGPFVVLTGVYLVGFAAYLLVFRLLVPLIV